MYEKWLGSDGLCDLNVGKFGLSDMDDEGKALNYCSGVGTLLKDEVPNNIVAQITYDSP